MESTVWTEKGILVDGLVFGPSGFRQLSVWAGAQPHTANRLMTSHNGVAQMPGISVSHLRLAQRTSQSL